MHYLHTMVRVGNLDAALDFYCAKLGLKELRRVENKAGRFTLVFLATPADASSAAAMFGAIGSIQEKMNRSDEAIQAWESARELRQKINDRSGSLTAAMTGSG